MSIIYNTLEHDFEMLLRDIYNSSMIPAKNLFHFTLFLGIGLIPLKANYIKINPIVTKTFM